MRESLRLEARGSGNVKRSSRWGTRDRHHSPIAVYQAAQDMARSIGRAKNRSYHHRLPLPLRELVVGSREHDLG